MDKMMSRSLNPMQLALVYKSVVELTNGTDIATDREKLKDIIKDEYHKQFPNSFMPKDDKEETITTIYNNYGRIEELAIELGIKNIDILLDVIKKGVKSFKKI